MPITHPYIARSSGETLSGFIQAKAGLIREKLDQHGAVLFRGFSIKDPHTFENGAKLIDPDLKNDYLGTSPRNKLTDYVFSASELPSHYPIMQHCEMSFLPFVPRKLFFWCKMAPKSGGETPTCDFASVYRELNPEIRSEFEEKGVTMIRNYVGPESKSKNVKQLKPWPDLFQTTDKNKVESICREYELQPHWLPGDGLRLINTRPAILTHPLSGEKIWFNHTQVFHSSAARFEYAHIAVHQNNLRSFALALFLKLNDLRENHKIKPEDRAMHVTFGNGDPIPDKYVKHIQSIIWKNMSIIPWKSGDMLAIDNFRTAHGRLPYSGAREVNVCWSADR